MSQGTEAEPGERSHSQRAVIAALLANLAIAAGKFVAFAFTGSSSMLAEGVHSLADTGNQCLLLLGAHRARKQADDEHPFGYGRERYFWSFVVALVLFSLGSLFALHEAADKIRHPETLDNAVWAFGILGFAIVMESLSFRTAVKESAAVKGDATYPQFIRHAKIPELPIVLLEDFAALCGLAFALAAVSATVITGNGVYDGYGTLAIGILLGIVAIVLAIEMKSLLIGEAAGRKQLEAIRAAIEIEPGVIQLIHMRTEHLGPDELLICAKVEFIHQLTLVEVAEAVDRVERNVRANVAEARVMYIEPDVAYEHRADPLVAEHEGHLDHDDPLWAQITGQQPAMPGLTDPEGQEAAPARPPS